MKVAYKEDNIVVDKAVLRYLSLLFYFIFFVGNFDARYFLGVNFQAHKFLGGSQYDPLSPAMSTPWEVYCQDLGLISSQQDRRFFSSSIL